MTKATTLTPIQRSVAMHLVNGLAPEDIAAELGISVRKIYYDKSNSTFATYLDKLADEAASVGVKAHAETQAFIQSKQLTAMTELFEIGTDKKVSASTRSRTLIALLHMGGFKPKDKLEVEGATPHLALVDTRKGSADSAETAQEGE